MQKQKVIWDTNPHIYKQHIQELEKFVVEKAIIKPKTEKEIFHECVVLPNRR